MKKIPEFPEITEEIKSGYNYWAIDQDGEFWVYKYKPELHINCWVPLEDWTLEGAQAIIILEGKLKDYKESIGKLSDGKPDNWDSLWVVEGPKYTTLTNREVLTALLEGKEIQEAFIGEGEEILKCDTVTYFPFFSTDDLDSSFRRLTYEENPCIYRIKPETKTVRVFNGVELPDCITEPLELGDTFYLALFGGVALRTWSYHTSELDAVVKGFAYLNREDAELHHKALTTYEVIEKGVS